MGPKVIKIIEIVFMSVMGVIILILGIFIIQRLLFKDKPVNILGFYLYEIDATESMKKEGDPDSLEPGDLIFVLKQKQYKVGDVVTYQLENKSQPTTHKIIEINGSIIRTQGINPNNAPDDPFDEKYIIGKVVGSWPQFYKFRTVMVSPYTIVTLVILGIGGAEGLSILEKKLAKKVKEKEEKNKEKIVNQNEEEIIQNSEEK